MAELDQVSVKIDKRLRQKTERLARRMQCSSAIDEETSEEEGEGPCMLQKENAGGFVDSAQDEFKKELNLEDYPLSSEAENLCEDPTKNSDEYEEYLTNDAIPIQIKQTVECPVEQNSPFGKIAKAYTYKQTDTTLSSDTSALSSNSYKCCNKENQPELNPSVVESLNSSYKILRNVGSGMGSSDVKYLNKDIETFHNESNLISDESVGNPKDDFKYSKLKHAIKADDQPVSSSDVLQYNEKSSPEARSSSTDSSNSDNGLSLNSKYEEKNINYLPMDSNYDPYLFVGSYNKLNISCDIQEIAQSSNTAEHSVSKSKNEVSCTSRPDSQNEFQVNFMKKDISSATSNKQFEVELPDKYSIIKNDKIKLKESEISISPSIVGVADSDNLPTMIQSFPSIEHNNSDDKKFNPDETNTTPHKNDSPLNSESIPYSHSPPTQSQQNHPSDIITSGRRKRGGRKNRRRQKRLPKPQKTPSIVSVDANLCLTSFPNAR